MIISLFDDDLYKFTMQQAALKRNDVVSAKYRFKNRGNHRFNDKFMQIFKQKLGYLAELKANDNELELFGKLPFIEIWYLDFLRDYRYNLKQIEAYLDSDNNLQITITGPWHLTILWEVKLMAIISEVYFQIEKDDGKWSMSGQELKLQTKANKLASEQCKYADFGTRRRRSFLTQDLVVKTFKNYHHFIGTSNVHLAFKYGLKPIGTMAHEWVQAMSALESLNHANRAMLQQWIKAYGASLGIALTDTFGTDAFFRDFEMPFAKMFDGVRHDSGDPFKFADKTVAHYKNLGIKPSHKTIVFSDGLNPDLAVKIQKHCNKLEINSSFGIGTNFTNDFETPALNMVIKLWEINEIPVVKISDTPSKANGDPKMIEAVKYIYQIDA